MARLRDGRTSPWFFCRGCGTTKIDTPMLRLEVWKAASSVYPMCVMPAMNRSFNGPPDLLCIACVEKALGRMIQMEDLFDCLGNHFTMLVVDRIKKGLYNT